MSHDQDFKSVVFMADFLKVDDRSTKKYEDPNKIHVDWLYNLFEPLFSFFLKIPSKKFISTDSSKTYNRFSFYSTMKLPFSSSGWAISYEGQEEHINFLCNALDELRGSLVIGFELSPLICKSLDYIGVNYIDLTLHSIRFLPDYIFGMRSNNIAWMSRILSMIIPIESIKTHARLSRARSARVYRNRNIDPGSAIFLGQLPVDSSLISDGKIISEDEIIDSIRELKLIFPNVYYKFHPHFSARKSLEETLKSIGIPIIDVNIYDLFDVEEVGGFCAISSGSLQEAHVFGRSTIRISNTEPSHAVTFTDVDANCPGAKYVPIPDAVYEHQFWQHVIFGDISPPKFTVDLPPQPLKFMLNQKWGR